MYNYEEFECLEITEEEKEAIQRYIGTFHTGMNSILDLDPDILINLSKKGWLINLSSEAIKDNIKYLEKIYSAMYKYEKKYPYSRNVYRGTTNEEVEKIKYDNSFGRFLSTSTSEEISKTFTEYKNGALISISIGENVPYLNMDEFLGDTQISEKEILIAPYCKVDNIREYAHNEDGSIRNYSLGLTKMEFNSLSDEESKECENNIYEFDFSEELKKFSKVSDELDIINSKIFNLLQKVGLEDPDLVKYLFEQKSQLDENYSESSNKFKNIKDYMNKYLQSKFKQIELDIDKEIAKEEAIVDENRRKERIESYRKSKDYHLQSANSVIENIEKIKSIYLSQDEEEKRLNELADSMLLLNKNDAEIETITNMFDTLKSNIEEIKKEIEEIEISDDFTLEMLNVRGELNSKLNEKSDELTYVSHILQECEQDINLQKSQNVEMLQKKIAEKIRESVIDKTTSDLLLQRNSLQHKKDSFFDRIFGKAKLKQAQIENLNLKIESVKKGGLNIPANFEGVENYLKKYSQVVGADKLPKEAQEFLKNTQKTDILELTDKEREEFELYFNAGTLVDVNKKISRKDMLVNISIQNQKLSTQINDVQTKEVASDKFYESLYKQEISKVEQDLDMAISLSEKNIPSEDKERMQKKEIEDPNYDVISF